MRETSESALRTPSTAVEARPRRAIVLEKVTATVETHRLQKMRDLLTFQKLATWKRMNGFDRLADGDDNCFYGPRSLPPTPEEFAADLRAEVNTLTDAILSTQSNRVK